MKRSLRALVLLLGLVAVLVVAAQKIELPYPVVLVQK